MTGIVSSSSGSAGVSSLAGTANQITASASTGAVTLSVPSDFRLPGTINLLTLTQPATAATLTLANNKTFTVSNTLTLAGTDSTTLTFPTTSATIARTDAGQTFTGSQVVSSGSFGLSGAISSAAWTTAGIRYANVAATLTDTTSFGTVAAAYTDVFGGNTIAASSAVTFTKYATFKVTAPTAGTNVTFTNSFAIDADSLNVGTSGVFKVSTAGVLTTTGAQLTTPTLGVAVATSLALGGATIGTDALGVTGSATIGGTVIGSTGKITLPSTIGLAFSNNAGLFYVAGTGILSVADSTNSSYQKFNALGFGFSGSQAQFTSPTTASIQQGALDAAVAVAQTLRVQSVVAGTAAANGANWTLIGSLPTGTGTSGDIIFQTGVKTGSGTTQGTATTALTIKGETQAVTIASGKSLVLGNAATTGLAAGVLAATTNATVVITDSAGQAYRIPCII